MGRGTTLGSLYTLVFQKIRVPGEVFFKKACKVLLYGVTLNNVKLGK
jgi:hypothetical protein